MKKTIFTIFIIFLAITSCLNFVSAENETGIMLADNEEESKSRTDEEVKSTESGNFNITFDDDYNGYCIDYGKHDATEGDTFSVKDTSYAVNHNSGEEVGNYLKIYFFEYYEEAMKNEIVTQHTIWHFTDNFNGWRLDYDLIEDIKNTALTKTIPDHGAVKQNNDTTEMVFDFEVLYSGREDYQNFFGYKITYRDIAKESENNQFQSAIKNPLLNSQNNNNTSTSIENTSSNSSNANGFSREDERTRNPESNNPGNESEYKIIHKNTNQIEDEKNSTIDINNPSVSLSKHVTGQKRNLGILMLLIILTFVAVKYIRRD